MDFKQFQKEWKDVMVFKPSEFDVEQTLNDFYTEYKTSLNNYGKDMTVKEWCEFFFEDFDLDDHPYMIKEKAMKTHHSNSLREMANEYRKKVGLPLIPLVSRGKKV